MESFLKIFIALILVPVGFFLIGLLGKIGSLEHAFRVVTAVVGTELLLTGIVLVFWGIGDLISSNS